MRAILRLLVAIALGLSSTPLLAHGDENHGTKGAQATTAELQKSESGRDTTAQGEVAVASDAMIGPNADQDRSNRVMHFLKSLHPATVHFPIALFLMAALVEAIILVSRSPEREAAVRIMLYGAAAGALVAVAFGWLHTGLWFGGGAVMQIHRWNGMLITILGLAAAWIAHRQPVSRLALRLLLLSIAGLLIVQGFMGGELAHGDHHLKL